MHCQAEISNQHVIQDLWDKNGDESKAKAMRKQDCTVLVPKRRGQDDGLLEQETGFLARGDN